MVYQNFIQHSEIHAFLALKGDQIYPNTSASLSGITI